jgi:predicted phosphodiesterase
VRVLVVSDVHANLRALDAVLDAAGQVDALWHLGDVVGYGPDPDAVVDRLRSRNAVGVRGNHDAAAIGELGIEQFNDDARAAMEWTRDAIRSETRAWLRALPERAAVGEFTLVHGSPRDPTWEYITSAGIARANLSAFETPYCLFGHTHVPTVFREEDGSVGGVVPRTGASVRLAGNRALVNPGSVGQPRDGIRTASYLILDTERSEGRWRRAAYDIAGTQAAMRAVRLPPRLVARLEHGF